jgi:cellulose synthase/poly-beta-1,6-N-acetylglucosamine synthase-like glycosyltransferase
MVVLELILCILVLFFFALPFFIFGTYGIIIFYYYKFKKTSPKILQSIENNQYEPTVSIVIPTHNEKTIISKKIENLLSLEYPSEKCEIIFVDDSTDSTPGIIQKYADNNPSLHLMRFNERMGYSPSMIEGVKVSKGEIIVLGDAGSFMHQNTIRNLVANFKDQSIGAVTGDAVIINSDENIGKSEGFYVKILRVFRAAESKMDSVFIIKGEATAVRANLIKDLQQCYATFDTAVGLFLREKGHRVIFDPQVKFFEYAPQTHTELVKQKTIRAANLIKILFQFRHLFFKPKLGKYGSIILPFNFAMLVIAPISILLGTLLLIPLSLFNVGLFWIIWAVIGGFLLLTYVLARTVLVTFFDFEFSLLKAIRYIVVKKKKLDQIDTVASTRRAFGEAK